MKLSLGVFEQFEAKLSSDSVICLCIYSFCSVFKVMFSLARGVCWFDIYMFDDFKLILNVPFL